MRNENGCYGKMFPSVIDIVHNHTVSGEVFGYRVDFGGAVVQKRESIVNRTGWDKCLECAELESCYRLSTGKLLMELVVRTVPQTLY
jgi:hypothetical protein